ncbi:MAG TPA: hypothetical protein VJB37_00930 [Patescibacteria group bacterium]|nr:hypothetical protein [Patescibacteria group bacterium]
MIKKSVVWIVALVIFGGLAWAAYWLVNHPRSAEVPGLGKNAAAFPSDSEMVEAEPFFVSYFSDKSAGELENKDLLGYWEGYIHTWAAEKYGNDLFVLADNKILRFDATGRLIARSRPEIAPCQFEDFSERYFGMTIVGDRLFLACQMIGIYEIDLLKNQVVYKYTEKDGFKTLENFQFASMGQTLWVGTTAGVARINTQDRNLVFYDDELGTGGTNFSSRVRAKGGEVWAEVIANAGSAGGLSHYDPELDKWVAFGPAHFFPNRSAERVDFDDVLLTVDGELLAVYSDEENDSRYDVLAKYDEKKADFIIAARIKRLVGYETSSEFAALLPPPEEYMNWREQPASNGAINLEYYDGQAWIGVPVALRLFYNVTPLSVDSYLVHSSVGLEQGRMSDFSLTTLANFYILDSYYSALKISPDGRVVVILSLGQSEMDGLLSAYNFAVYDWKTKESFTASLSANPNEPGIFENDGNKDAWVTWQEGTIDQWILNVGGQAKFLIDLENKKIVRQ